MSMSADLDHCRAVAEAEAKAQKDPYITVNRLTAFYHALERSEREEAGRVFASWLASPENRIWHLGLTMIGKLRITAAIPELIRLADRFRGSHEAGSREWAEAADDLVSKLIAASRAEADDRTDL